MMHITGSFLHIFALFLAIFSFSFNFSIKYRIINERQVDAGSTTAIIAQICSQQEEADKKKKKKSSKKEKKVKKDDNLCVANLGDSTCVVLRPRNGSYEVIFRSKEQQVSFFQKILSFFSFLLLNFQKNSPF